MGIEIHVITGLDGQSASVRASGSVQHIITDAERNTFGINDAALKNAVAGISGKRPMTPSCTATLRGAICTAPMVGHKSRRF